MVVDEEENEFGSHEVKCEQNDHLFIILVAKYRRAEGAIKHTVGRREWKVDIYFPLPK